MDDRLPAQLEVGGLIRAVEASGGFATVLAKGERQAGTILVVCCEQLRPARIFERMPSLDGGRDWVLSKEEDSENKQEFQDYLVRRKNQDDDLWIVELDIADGERFIGFR